MQFDLIDSNVNSTMNMAMANRQCHHIPYQQCLSYFYDN